MQDQPRSLVEIGLQCSQYAYSRGMFISSSGRGGWDSLPYRLRVEVILVLALNRLQMVKRSEGASLCSGESILSGGHDPKVGTWHKMEEIKRLVMQLTQFRG